MREGSVVMEPAAPAKAQVPRTQPAPSRLCLPSMTSPASARPIIGGWLWRYGTRSLPDHVRLSLDLLGERRFANGAIHLHYRIG